jgi:WD40 repeat protein
MLPSTRALTVFASLAALATVTAAPVERVRPTPITPANASHVRRIGEVPQDVWRLVWGPGAGQVSLLGWETPVEVLDLRSLKPLRRIAAGRKLIHFAAAADGNTVAWCENSTRVEVVNLRSDKALVLDAGNQQPSMAFSPDGKLLATCGYGTEAKLWDPVTGRLVRSLDAGPAEGGLTAVFSPDGKVVAVGNRNAETRLFETASGKVLHTLPRKMSQELRFSPDGSTLAVAYVDGHVGLWDVARGTLLRERASGAEEVYTLDWSPAGDVLVTAGRSGKIVLWDPRDLSALKELEAPEWVIQARFSPDGSRLFTAGGTSQLSPERKVVIWGVSAGDKEKK